MHIRPPLPPLCVSVTLVWYLNAALAHPKMEMGGDAQEDRHLSAGMAKEVEMDSRGPNSLRGFKQILLWGSVSLSV